MTQLSHVWSQIKQSRKSVHIRKFYMCILVPNQSWWKFDIVPTKTILQSFCLWCTNAASC